MNLRATALALIAVLLWASGALLVLSLERIPALLMAAYSGTVCLGGTSLYLSIRKRWSILPSSKKLWGVAALLVGISQISYIVAFKNAPAVQVDLINYLWPSFLVFAAGGMPGRFTPWLVIALGAGGLYLALDPGALYWSFLPGYLIALLAALSWTAYSLVVAKSNLPPEFVCMTVGLSAPVSWLLHFAIGEPTPILKLGEFFLVLSYGIGVYLIAFLCWAMAMRSDGAGATAVFGYFIPLVSVGFLILAGHAELTLRIAVATIMILLAAALPALMSRLVSQNRLQKR